jgi:polysaccharide deacetylase family protein (PEP-CTERM system associated)
MLVNALTIDLEEWYHANILNGISFKKRSTISESTEIILNILNQHRTKATFFVLGEVAEKNPSLIEEIYKQGHEIGCHGYSHKMLTEMSREEFKRELKKATGLIKSITGEQPIGFRAPSFSINNKTSWTFDVLKEIGYKYDSSIFPIKTPLYGVPDAPLDPYYPSKHSVEKASKSGKIKEFPPSVIKILGKSIPIAGGFYFRAFPLRFIQFAIKRINKKGRFAVMYFHPWEFYEKVPRIKLSWKSYFVQYYGINKTKKKFEHLLKNFKFQPLREFL